MDIVDEEVNLQVKLKLFSGLVAARPDLAADFEKLLAATSIEMLDNAAFLSIEIAILM